MASVWRKRCGLPFLTPAFANTDFNKRQAISRALHVWLDKAAVRQNSSLNHANLYSLVGTSRSRPDANYRTAMVTALLRMPACVMTTGTAPPGAMPVGT